MVLFKKSNLHPVWLAAISGVLLWVSWPTSPLTLLIFTAWVPLFILEARSKRLLPFWGWTYLTLLIWNVATTWWVGNTPVPISGVLANVLNALIMTVPWIGFWKAKRRFGVLPGYAALVAYWLTFEYIHLNWELSWPWLTLGNVFAGVPGWVQWYEWTGTSGGTLWVLVVNILLFEAIISQKSKIKRFKATVLTLLTPLAISGILYACRHNLSAVPENGPNVVVVQPNIDPYNEKFEIGTDAAQLAQLISLSESAVDSNTDVVIWPETALPFEVNEPNFWQVPLLKPLHAFLARHPRIKLLTGLAGLQYLPKDTVTMAMRYDSATGRNYEEYNSALQTDSSRAITFYHKGKLVPGAEIMPYRWLFGFLDKYSLDLGGTSGTYGRGMERVVFPSTQSGYRIAPIICYESIYSAYVTGYVRNGANLLAIITNDGWWGNTQGYKQHQQYARLRAIETRRWVARSANTGISCFIDPLGKVYQPQPWNKEAVIKMNLPAENLKTLYVTLGDWISILAIIWTILSQGASIAERIRKRLG